MTTQATDVNALTVDQIANMDMDQLNALVQENEPAEEAEPVVEGDSTNPDEGSEDKGEEAAEDKTEEDDAHEGVATRDGKGVIPYDVLKQTREENKTLRTQAEELAKQKADADAKLEELSKKLESQMNGTVEDADLFTEEELEAMAEDLPDTANRLRAMQNKFKQYATNLQQKQAEEEQQQAQTVKSNVQQAIDDVPKLAYLQSSNPRLFKLAQQIDQEIRQKAQTDPTLAGLTLTQRFERVVKELEKDLGTEIKLPGAKKAIEVQEQRINGLDDLPGGASPVVDELEAKLQKSPTELANDLQKMTPEQLEEFMDRASRYV